MRELPIGKAPGLDLVMYEHFKFGSGLLHEKLSILFNAIIKFVKIPELFKLGLLIPLYKGKRKARSKKDSCRGVTLMSCINNSWKKWYGYDLNHG